MQLGQIESILGVVLSKALFASHDWLRSGQPVDNHVVRVLGHEPFEIMCVVGVKLPLRERNRVKVLGHVVRGVRGGVACAA